MNRKDPAAILADLECLISDTRDALDASDEASRLSLVHLANARECIRRVVEPPSRPSWPVGVWEENQPKRRTATESFRESRRILKGIKS